MASPQGQFKCVFHVSTIPQHDEGMELYDVMRTTGAVRRFTDDPLPDEVLERILDNARFAPSGGNRQGVRVIVVRDRPTREAIADLACPARSDTSRSSPTAKRRGIRLRPCGVDGRRWPPPRCRHTWAHPC